MIRLALLVSLALPCVGQAILPVRAVTDRTDGTVTDRTVTDRIVGPTRVTISATAGRTAESWHGQLDISSLNVEVTRDKTAPWEISGVAGVHSLSQPQSWFGYQFGEGNERAYGVSASLQVRRRFARRWYAEGSTGPMITNIATPESTSKFNFITQLGAGAVLFNGSRTPLLVGYRFQHISNGGYSPRNPGWNVNAIVVGVRVR
jgi:hypothetical protein